MSVVFEKPHSLCDVNLHYCPGCTHGIIHRLVCEVIDEMGIEGNTVGICPVGCSVFTYQGDGDLAAIGTAETVHAATRGENIVVIFINNTTYGMTGGQMAPTTLPGQVTQTTPFGRDPKVQGYPIRVCEMLSTLSGTALAQRVAVDSVPHINEAKKAIRKAFENERDEKGFSIVEVLSTCPTNWGLSPVEALERLRTDMIPYYPLGVFKDCDAKNPKEEK